MNLKCDSKSLEGIEGMQAIHASWSAISFVAHSSNAVECHMWLKRNMYSGTSLEAHHFTNPTFHISLQNTILVKLEQ